MSAFPPWLTPFAEQDAPFQAAFGSPEARQDASAWRGQGLRPGNVRLPMGIGGVVEDAFGMSYNRPGSSTVSFLSPSQGTGIGQGIANFGQNAQRNMMTGNFLNFGYPGDRFISDPDAARTPMDTFNAQLVKQTEEMIGAPFWSPQARNGTVNNRNSPGLTAGGTNVGNRLSSPPGWAQNRWDQMILNAVGQAEQMTGVFVPPNVVKAVMRIESPGGQMTGDNPSPGVWGSAIGLMQLTSNTNDGGHGFDWNRAKTDAQYNILFGAIGLASWYTEGKRLERNGDSRAQNLTWTDVANMYFSGSGGLRDFGRADKYNTVLQYRNAFETNMAILNGTTNINPGFANPNINHIWGGEQFGISQGFGLTDHSQGNSDYAYSSQYTPGGKYGGHIGIDVSMPIGTAIFAPLSGTIRTDGAAFNDDGGGIGRISLILDNGDEIIFGHMRTLGDRLTNGVRISAGTFVGRSGTAGTGPHLHLEVRAKQQQCTTPSCYLAVDPRQYFTGGAIQAGAEGAVAVDPTAGLIPGLPSARGLTSPWGRGTIGNIWG